MTRLQIIHKVKVLLDEVSPFEEDDTTDFMDIDPALPDDIDYSKVKPIYTMINDQLDEAARYCLKTLPFKTLSDDIEEDEMTVHIGTDGVGHIHDIESDMRFVSARVPKVWERTCMDFITSSDPRYLIQENPHKRAGVCKPVCAYVPERHILECYSFPREMWPKDDFDKSYKIASVAYIKTSTKAEKVKSDVVDYIAIICAHYVCNIEGATDAATTFMNMFATKINSL